MIVREYTILAPEGLHARPAKELAKLTKKYDSGAVLKKGGETFDARSLIGIVTAEVSYMSKITMEIAGPEEEGLAEALDHFFEVRLVQL